MEKPLSVDQFIANAVPEAQRLLTELRRMIQSAFPGIEEEIGHGVPQYRYGSAKLGLSLAQKHVTLGFHYGAISDEKREQLKEKGYKLGLQTLQIQFAQNIPTIEIQGIFDEIRLNSKK